MPKRPRISKRELGKRFFQGMKENIRASDSLEKLGRLEAAIKRAKTEKGTGIFLQTTLLQRAAKKRAHLIESKKREIEFLGKVTIHHFAENPELVERSLADRIKALRGGGLEKWEARQIAYRKYAAKKGLPPLFDAFYSNAGRRLEREKHIQRHRRIRDPRIAEAIRKGYKWETFHVNTDRLLRKFGFGNIYSLAKMFSKVKEMEAKEKGIKTIKILDFFPHEKYMQLQVEIPTKEGVIRDTVAIERMESGKITRLGDPVKYMVHEELKKKHFKGGDWFEERERELAGRYEKIMNALNDLVG